MLFGEGDFVAMAAIELSTGAIKVTVKLLGICGAVFEHVRHGHAGAIGVVHAPQGIVGGSIIQSAFYFIRTDVY